MAGSTVIVIIEILAQERDERMEIRAYLEGITRRWWLILSIVLLSLVIGHIIGINLTAKYTASTDVLINDALLANTAFPSKAIQLNVVTSYAGSVLSPLAEERVSKSYPRLPAKVLQQEVTVTLDTTNQIMLINVTDPSSSATADIANYLARQFVATQTASMQHQLTYYQQWLQQQIGTLTNEINQLNQQIDAVTPQREIHGPPPTLTPTQKLTFTEDISNVDLDNRKLYDYQQSLLEVQQVLPMVNQAYVIIKAATVPQSPNTTPLPTIAIEAIALVAGLLLAICLCIALDFFTPLIRHQGELTRIIEQPTFAIVPALSTTEQKRLLEIDVHTIRSISRLKQLRLFCATVGALAMQQPGRSILLTSLRHRRKIAAILAIFLARKGLKTLLIDADFLHPSLHQQIATQGSAQAFSKTGQPLPFIMQTVYSNLFLLPASAALPAQQSTNRDELLALLPTLQSMFDIILIDAPPMEYADTHLFMTKVTQIFLFIKKRGDSLKTLQRTHVTCEMLKTSPYYIFLT